MEGVDHGPVTGDEAFRRFYERMDRRAVATARRLVGDPVTAEDLAAEALARAYAHWPKVRSHPNPDAWLLRVLGNLAIDHVRRRRRTSPTDLHGGSSAADDAVLRVDLARAMKRLSNRQQEVVVLRYLVDLPEAEVAESLGMTTGSVKTHLSRATRRLRDELGDGPGDQTSEEAPA